MVVGAGEFVAAGVDRGNVVCAIGVPRSMPSATAELFAIRKIKVSQQSDGKLLPIDLSA
jgi:hypothetical protein